MNNKLMIEMLRRGKTGNEIMLILDAVAGDALTPAARDIVVQSVNYKEDTEF